MVVTGLTFEVTSTTAATATIIIKGLAAELTISIEIILQVSKNILESQCILHWLLSVYCLPFIVICSIISGG